MNKALHTPAELVSAGLAPEAAPAELEAVAARYSTAATPAVAALT